MYTVFHESKYTFLASRLTKDSFKGDNSYRIQLKEFMLNAKYMM